jgi:hypothetical protein
VEQSLVSEGVFAVQLAEALTLGSALDEAKAECLPSNIGIEPKIGWISDYPVTPAVIGDIEQGLATAIEQSKLAMGKDQALRVVDDVMSGTGKSFAQSGGNTPVPIPHWTAYM